MTRQTDPEGNVTHYAYDHRGCLVEITHADGSLHQLTPNPLGQLIEEQLPDGSVRRYRYDTLGRQITRQDESGAITRFQWDAAGRLSQITLPGGASRMYRYNAYGKVTSECDEQGRMTRYEYLDDLHRSAGGSTRTAVSCATATKTPGYCSARSRTNAANAIASITTATA
ncbi:hypothetical protein P4203_29630 [Pseudomonas aeruginosa]|nr:hypothetical protein [Pseudomonas aeruginosa]